MKLKTYRKKNGLSQTEFAALAGCATSQISRYEAGLIKPSFDRLMVIERITKGRVKARDFADDCEQCAKTRGPKCSDCLEREEGVQ